MVTLHELLSSGPWIVIPGPPDADSTVFVLAWPNEMVDTIRIPRDPDEDVLVIRSNHFGRRLWSHEGSHTECLAEYANWPAPMALGALHDSLDDAADCEAADRST